MYLGLLSTGALGLGVLPVSAQGLGLLSGAPQWWLLSIGALR